MKMKPKAKSKYKGYVVVAALKRVTADKKDIFYHGAKGRTIRKIVKEKTLKVPTKELLLKKYKTTEDEGTSVPVRGRVYVTKDLGYALMYAIGANMVGHESDVAVYKRLWKEGGIVVVEPKVESLYPDEDWVGEQFLDAYYNDDFDGKVYNLIRDALEDCNKRLLLEIENLRYEDDEGKYAWSSVDHHIKYGKKIIYCLENLKPEVMAEVASHAPNLSHAGDLEVKEAWVFDVKKVNPELKKDGSNFFELAEQIL